MIENNPIDKRNLSLAELRELQPYSTSFHGLKLDIFEDVFPPDHGLGSEQLAYAIEGSNAKSALDMGCGAGHLALVLKKSGVDNVWAVDNHESAIKCTENNVELNNVGDIHVVKSDLFESIPLQKFDVIVFNQPYYPLEKKIYGMGSDGGLEIIERFFQEAKEYLSPDGYIVMPFSDFAGEENNPAQISKRYSYSSEIIDKSTDSNGVHLVYKLSPSI